MRLLAGDVGGTNTRLALASLEPGAGVRIEARSVYSSRDFPGLGAAVSLFLSTHAGGAPVDRAACGVAGPVVDGRCVATNLPWIVDAQDLRRAARAEEAWIFNDLEAMARGIEALGEKDLETLNPGIRIARGNAALLAAGTGLGEAILFFDGKRLIPSPSEGGHSDFAPRNADEEALLEELMREHGHVSVERVLSGPGLERVYEFFARRDRKGPEPERLRLAREEGKLAPAVSEEALTGADPISVRALDLFVSVYGAEASNLALKAMATAGVYLGGGIAPKISKKLRDGSFLAAFLDKGRLRPVLAEMPVHVIKNEMTALLGAALYAASGPLR